MLQHCRIIYTMQENGHCYLCQSDALWHQLQTDQRILCHENTNKIPLNIELLEMKEKICDSDKIVCFSFSLQEWYSVELSFATQLPEFLDKFSLMLFLPNFIRCFHPWFEIHLNSSRHALQIVFQLYKAISKNIFCRWKWWRHKWCILSHAGCFMNPVSVKVLTRNLNSVHGHL